MAEIIGNIATAIEERHSQSNPSATYFSFRLAENTGRGANRTTTWYDVRAKLNPQDATSLKKGDLVRIRGRLEVQPFLKKRALSDAKAPGTWEEVVKDITTQQALGTSLILFTSSIQPHVLQAAPPRGT